VHIFAATIPGWEQFKDLIFLALEYFYGLTNDWGLAIILLTIALRIIILPLTWKQTVSMYEMQKVQPKIKALQEKYKNDKEKLQEETLKFYQENKVNPFGGCLPLLLQMPIFFALFNVLRSDLPDDASFLGIIPNLTYTPKMVYTAAAAANGAGPVAGVIAALPYLILVVVFAVSIWLPQALMPGDKQQKMIGAYMAIVMLFFGWSSPAGVLLYWDVSSIWGVAQQQVTMAWMNRRLEKDGEPAEPEGKPKKSLPKEQDVTSQKKSAGKKPKNS